MTKQIQARSLTPHHSNTKIADLIRANHRVVLHDDDHAENNRYSFNATFSDAPPKSTGIGGGLFTEKMANMIQKRTGIEG